MVIFSFYCARNILAHMKQNINNMPMSGACCTLLPSGSSCACQLSSRHTISDGGRFGLAMLGDPVVQRA